LNAKQPTPTPAFDVKGRWKELKGDDYNNHHMEGTGKRGIDIIIGRWEENLGLMDSGAELERIPATATPHVFAHPK
jgi:hypothetical protein